VTSTDLLDAAPARTAGAAAAPGLRAASARRTRGRGPGLPFGAVSGTWLGLVVLWLSVLVLLPLAAVVGKAFTAGAGSFWDAISGRESRDALILTVLISLGVAVVNTVVGTAVAWVLVRDRFRGASLLEFVIDIPFALPTIVAGTVMLALYGNDSPVGISLFGSRIGLLVTLLFVTLPFTVRTVQPVLADLDRDAEQAAASLGASPQAVFTRIVLPQVLPAAASGAALAFARALGEYGSLVFISSKIPYHTEVASMLIYAKLQDSDQPAAAEQQAASIATVLLLASAIVLIVLEIIQRRVARRG